MPDHHIPLDEADMAVLELVRQKQGLQTVEQAAEWLAKTRLRRTARGSNGRGRALYAVPKAPQGGQP